MNEKTNKNELSNQEEILGEEDQAGIPTTEELAAENESLKTIIRMRDARDDLTAVLKRSGARSPSLMFAYAVDDLQFDDDGKLANREAIVAKLKNSFPEQFAADAPRSVDGGAGTAQRTSPLTKETLARMSPAEIAKLDWANVRQVLSK